MKRRPPRTSRPGRRSWPNDPTRCGTPRCASRPIAVAKLEHVRLIAEQVPVRDGRRRPRLDQPRLDPAPTGSRRATCTRNSYADIRCGVRRLCRAPRLGSAARDLRARVPAVRAHLPPRRPPSRGLDGEALLRRRVGHVGPRAAASPSGCRPPTNALLAYLDMLEGTDLPVVGVGVGRRPHGHAGGSARARARRPPPRRPRGALRPRRKPTNVELVEQAVALAARSAARSRLPPTRSGCSGCPSPATSAGSSSNAALTCSGSSCWIQWPEPAIHTGSRRFGTTAAGGEHRLRRSDRRSSRTRRR